MIRNYSQWPEDAWTSDELRPGIGSFVLGVDVGTTSAQAAVLRDGQVLGWANIRCGADFCQDAQRAAQRALGGRGVEPTEAAAVVATGFAANCVTFATKQVDEIHCHARGARFLYGPEVHTVVDLGAQTVNAIRLYDWDRVWDFMVGDKCAGGMGRELEELCELLEVPITELGARSLEVSAEPEPVSTTCYPFARTETIGLFRPGFREEPLAENAVYASHLFAMAWRALGTIGKLAPLDVGELKIYPQLGFTGGLAKNPGITKRIERELGVTAMESRWDPMLAGAIGAALLA